MNEPTAGLSPETTIESLKVILQDVVEIKIDLGSITPQTPLFDEGLGLDSFAVIDVIMGIEEHFGVEFSDTDFLPENFANLKSLGALVDRYLGQPGASETPLAQHLAEPQ